MSEGNQKDLLSSQINISKVHFAVPKQDVVIIHNKSDSHKIIILNSMSQLRL